MAADIPRPGADFTPAPGQWRCRKDRPHGRAAAFAAFPLTSRLNIGNMIFTKRKLNVPIFQKPSKSMLTLCLTLALVGSILSLARHCVEENADQWTASTPSASHEAKKELDGHYNRYKNGEIGPNEMLAACDAVLARTGRLEGVATEYAHIFRSRVFDDLGNYKAALIEARKALATFSRSIEGRIQFGIALSRRGRVEEAASAWQGALYDGAQIADKDAFVAQIVEWQKEAVVLAPEVVYYLILVDKEQTEKITGRHITVSGQVRGFGKDNANHPTIQLIGEDTSKFYLECGLSDGEEDALVGLKEGQTLLLYGYCCDWHSEGLTLTDSIVVKSNARYYSH